MTTQIPRDGRGDRTLAVLTEGYEFITRRCQRLDTDVFETTLQFEPTICMRGEAAAELFYDEERFTRHDAAPSRLEKTLFGVGGVQGMDGEGHRQRKAMFMDLMTPERLTGLRDDLIARWNDQVPVWEQDGWIVLHDEAGLLVTEAIYAWAGLPLEAEEVPKHLAAHLGMIVGAPGIAHRYVWGRAGRHWTEAWVSDQVERVRRGEAAPPEDSALHVIAHHRDADGQTLDAQTAAVEIINLLRPTIAVDRYITFVALALHDHPEWRERLVDADDATVRAFVQEVRRTAPFFPFTAARVREDFTWNGMRFPEGRRVLLDLFGTNMDARIWPEPTRFRPDRHLDGEPSPFTLIPQGGGDHHQGHRCAGEWITVDLMQAATRCLTGGMTYHVPEQDLSIGRGRIPALPRSGFVMTDIQARDASGQATEDRSEAEVTSTRR